MSRPSELRIVNKIFITLLLGAVSLFSPPIQATEDPPEIELNIKNPSWENFDRVIKQKDAEDSIAGISYVISGSIATVGGLIGYDSSRDPLAKGIFALSQSIGIVAIGYGAYTWTVGNEHKPMHYSLSTSNLSVEKKTQMLTSYFRFLKEQEKKERLIRAVTHGLVAALNGYYASREPNQDLRSALTFAAGINALAALSFTF